MKVIFISLNHILNLNQAGTNNLLIIKLKNRVAGESKSTIPLSEVKLLPPISNPDKIACVGLNYKGHCKENNLPIPKQPIFFSKFSSCIIGPYDNIKYPEASNVSVFYVTANYT